MQTYNCQYIKRTEDIKEGGRSGEEQSKYETRKWGNVGNEYGQEAGMVYERGKDKGETGRKKDNEEKRKSKEMTKKTKTNKDRLKVKVTSGIFLTTIQAAHHMAWTETGLKTWTLFTVDTLKPLWPTTERERERQREIKSFVAILQQHSFQLQD